MNLSPFDAVQMLFGPSGFVVRRPNGTWMVGGSLSPGFKFRGEGESFMVALARADVGRTLTVSSVRAYVFGKERP